MTVFNQCQMIKSDKVSEASLTLYLWSETK